MKKNATMHMATDIQKKSDPGHSVPDVQDKRFNKMDPDSSFDEKKVLHLLKHHLPSQTPLKDFIHHNTLHAFQHMKFYDAIFKASKMFGYQVTLELSDYRKLYHTGRIRKEILERIIIQKKGAVALKLWNNNLLIQDYDECVTPLVGRLRSDWKSRYKLDLDSLVQPLLFRILCSYLDQGISIWNFPLDKDGFLASLKQLERNSFVGFFKTPRAKQLLLNDHCEITQLLKILVGNEAYYEQYLFDQQFSHQGWSGIVATIEEFPQSLHDRKNISLKDLIIFELLLEIDALDFHLGKNWEPLCNGINSSPVDLFTDILKTELHEVFNIWQEAFEWSYYDEVLAGIAFEKGKKKQEVTNKSFQAMFCIDERECSIRRHLEFSDPECETFGTPGFFGVEFYFQPENGKFYDKLCPAPVTPKYLIKEFETKDKRKHELLYTKLSHTFIMGFLISISLGFWSAVRLIQNIFKPKMSPAISNAFAHMGKDSQLTVENKNTEDMEKGLQIGFTLEEMTVRVEALLRNIGLIKDFAPLIYIVAHGSSSANNPHHGAHDCGACSGRPGSVNAKVMAIMANHQKVRALLRERGIHIPDETQFAGALHDTAADEIEFYNEQLFSSVNIEKHKKSVLAFENALDLNAKERSRRFASINTKNNIKKVRQDIKSRSVSLFEPRPELGHGTNTLCIVGGRNLTKGLFLDRRAFLNSYNYKTDLDGALLTGIMKPLGPVCGGISLEYYFSRMDNHKLGAGTKLPHHVMGLIGVANSCDGDLRPGLPLQMIEVHDPVRLLIIVEHFPEVVLNTIQAVPEMYEWFINEWVHLVVLNPETNEFNYFKDGTFTKYIPLTRDFNIMKDLNALLETAQEMETNYIVDATRENLPVYALK
ncbi:MAG: DUF2309 domain-containing protein [Bacteroidota bacterium]|nr:DUF2309 domain-containing protein [Bacteroidota bacterium]